MRSGARAPASRSAARIGLVALACVGSAMAAPAPLPETPVAPVVESFHGEFVADPYRWLEDTAAPATREWLEAQNAHARAMLDALPARAALRAEIATLLSASADLRAVRRVGDRVFALRREPGAQHHRLVMRLGTEGAERVVLDPVRFADGKAASIDDFAPAPNGRLVAASVSVGGGESAIVHVVDVDRGVPVGPPIPRADRGALAWRFDSALLYYRQMRALAPGADPAGQRRDAVVRMREFRDDAAGADVAVFGRTVGPGLPISSDGTPEVVVSPVSSWALGLVRHGTARELTVFAVPLTALRGPETPWRKIVDRAQGVEDVDLRGEWLYLRTSEDAPRYRLLRWSLRSPLPYRSADAEVVLPQGERLVAAFAVAKDALYVHERDGGVARLTRLEFNVRLAAGAAARRTRGKPPPAALPKPAGVARTTEIALPVAGAIAELVADPLHAGALVRLEGWAEPPGYFAVAPVSGAVARTSLLTPSPVTAGDAVVTQVRVASHDGMGVPLTLVARSLARDASAPVLIDAHGAHGIALGPEFQPWLKAWLDRGGVYAVAHVRGGGERGRDWHRAGQRAHKPNSWRDLVACAEHLVATRIGAPDRLFLHGRGAGGLTILGAIQARPELFRAVVSEGGLHDAIRGEAVASGSANEEEFGSATTPDGFRMLMAMSAYANVAEGTGYPAVLFTAGYDDPLAPAWDPAKMAARLQAIAAAPGGSGRPVLLSTGLAGRHGATLDQTIDALADMLAFLLWQANATGFVAQP